MIGELTVPAAHIPIVGDFKVGSEANQQNAQPTATETRALERKKGRPESRQISSKQKNKPTSNRATHAAGVSAESNRSGIEHH
jgi:hypothetical protein